MTLASGTKLGPYEVISAAGAGGMGEVYRARDTRLDRTVAIKILPAPLSDNPEAKQRGAKLMDFGLAKAATGPPPASGLTATLDGAWAGGTGAGESARGSHDPLTARGTIVGTFQYMSTEQIEGKEADARSDIFALGAVLYEMATGVRAFNGKTQASVIAAILAAEPQPISMVRPMSPPALDRVVKVCLAVEVQPQGGEFHAGVPRQIFMAVGGVRPLDTAPDGRILVALEAGQEIASPITLVLNWDAEMRK